MILYDKKEKENGKDYAYRVLKDNIMTLNLKPGELLSEADLSEKLGISRTPIREVLMRLKNEHLIEVKPQTGTYISLIDSNLIEEAMFMRYTLEREVLKEACKNISEETLMELEKNLFAQKLIADKPNSAIEFHKLDKEFHELLFEGTNKRNIWNSIVNISTHYNRMRLLSEMKTDKMTIIKQHEIYLDLINGKSSDGIDEIVTQHIKDPASDWLNVTNNDSLTEYFKK
ncbi:GntR family transcriptional regulator [Romboutsia sp.]|uniref:GntR family transcriptional regulator n=1 Tax=Romboutsia sp. TaxID=1965302 RepID=UPI003F3B5A34